MKKSKCQAEFEEYCKKYWLCTKKEDGRYVNNQHIYEAWRAAWQAALKSKRGKDGKL